MKALEKNPNIPEQAHDPEDRDKNYAKQEWFDAYYRGNAQIPQTGAGMSFNLLIETVLKSEDTNWREFLDSELSLQQIEFLGKAMSHMHKGHRVNVSTQEHAHKFETKPYIVRPKRLQQIWRSGTEMSIYMLGKYLRGRTNTLAEFGSNSYAQIANFIQDFFQDPKNKDEIEKLKIILSIIERALKKPSVKNLLSRYRDEFKKPSHLKGHELWEETYGPKFREEIMKDLEEMLGDELPSNLRESFFIGY